MASLAAQPVGGVVPASNRIMRPWYWPVQPRMHVCVDAAMWPTTFVENLWANVGNDGMADVVRRSDLAVISDPATEAEAEAGSRSPLRVEPEGRHTHGSEGPDGTHPLQVLLDVRTLAAGVESLEPSGDLREL